jgi:hypothetical protein
MSRLPAAGQAHRDKAGQRRGLQEPSVRRLDGLQHAQRPGPRRGAQPAERPVPRGPVHMARLPDRNQGRQGIAHHRHAHRREAPVRQRRQFKGQGQHMTPCRPALPQPPGQRAVGQNRHREGPVLAISRQDRRGQHLGVHAPGRPLQELLRPRHGRRMPRIPRRHRPECGPSQQRRAQVARAARGVAPAPVLILVPRQPVQPGGCHRLMPQTSPRPVQHGQRRHRRGGGQRAAGEFPHPAPVRAAPFQQPARDPAENRSQPGRVQGGNHGRHHAGRMNQIAGGLQPEIRRRPDDARARGRRPPRCPAGWRCRPPTGPDPPPRRACPKPAGSPPRAG